MKIRRAAFGGTVSLIGLAACFLAPSAAAAQEAPTDESVAESGAEGTITVTGSRVKRDGFQAPTPETVIGADSISASAPANLADLVNDLPAVAGSSTPRTATVNASSGSAGSNFLNLRGLGNTRTLVLLDGRRVVGATTDGVVDINTLPTALISRIDIVTGGASAAYGSDAVSGVANFILDTKFKGVKGQIQTGITDYGDGFKWRAELSGGMNFADGRGHVLVSGSYAKSDGVIESASRPWFRSQKIIPNPAFVAGNGQPTLVSAENVNIATAVNGGVILNGVLRGTSFGQGGVQQPFTFGTFRGNLTGTNYMIGGTHSDLADFWQLEIPLEQTNVFGRLSYDVSDAFKPYFEVTYSKAIADSQGPLNFRIGNITIQRDNAFLPDNLRTALTNAGQANFLYGLLVGDLPRQNPHNVRELQRFVLGADGELGGSWSYSLYGQYGRTNVDIELRNALHIANFGRAIDAVRNGSGQIVCRVNADVSTTNDDPSCAPFNPFGIGVNSNPAAFSYVAGTSTLRQKLEQTVVAGSVQGEPFSTWAGPVSVVVGAEYRKEQVSSTNDALSEAGVFIAGNYKATNGSYDIREVFGEVVMPLASDMPFLRKLELNGAVRHTDYSTSGTVQTWKLGLNWSPIDDLRLRGTISRDIRAPNLNDLYQAGVTSAAQSAVIPTGGIPGTTFVTGQTVSGFTAIAIGNPGLTPEKADSFTIGGVYQPSWLPGLSLSFDYYKIKIDGSIVVSTTQQVFNRCAAGNAGFCSDIQLNTAGQVVNVNRVPRNFATEEAKGFDIEARYTRELGNGRISARVLATHFITRTLSDNVSIDQSAGENTGGIPDWRIVSSIGYDSDTWGMNLATRTVTSGVYDKAYTAATLADNSIPGATYVDLGLVFKFNGFGAKGEFFVNVDNLFNKDPAIVPPQNQQFIVAPVNASLYDTMGREYRAGFRFKF